MSKTTSQVSALLQPEKAMKNIQFLPTGSTLLNLAISGKFDGGWPSGEYLLFVGDTDSGKTWCCLTCFAEAVRSKLFKHHRLIYDAPEGGAMMDIGFHFGKEVEKKLECKCSETLEDFYYSLDDDFKLGKPFIRILDSVDSLNAKADEKKFQETKQAYRKGNEKVKGTYALASPKTHSQFVRKIPAKLKETGSILIVINQSRDNINAGPFGPPKTRSGGRALEFFASVQLWSSIKRKNKVIAHKQGNVEKKLQTGIQCRIQVKRSRLTGKDRTVEFPISNTHGIDEIGSLVDYLTDWGYWNISKKVIDAQELGMMLKREALVRRIEKEGRELEIQSLVGVVWESFEEKAAIHRKRRYK